MNKSKLINSTESVVMPVNSLKSSYEKNELIVNKDYQTDLRWVKSQKSKLIVSIFDNYPLGEILRNRMINYIEDGIEEEYFELVDGQQRMVYSIFSFINNGFALTKEDSKYLIEGYYSYFRKEENKSNVKKMFDRYEKGEEVSLKYKNLPNKLQDKMNSYNISVRTLNYTNSSDIKEYFRRVQQGTPLKNEQIIHTVESELNDIIKDKMGGNENIVRFFKFYNENGSLKKDSENKLNSSVLEVLALYHDNRNIGVPKDLWKWVAEQNDVDLFDKSINKILTFFDDISKTKLKYEMTAGKTDIKLLMLLVLFTEKMSINDIFNITTVSSKIKAYSNKQNSQRYNEILLFLQKCDLADLILEHEEIIISFSSLRSGSHDKTHISRVIKNLESVCYNRVGVLV